jgi:hypothetical protein
MLRFTLSALELGMCGMIYTNIRTAIHPDPYHIASDERERLTKNGPLFYMLGGTTSDSEYEPMVRVRHPLTRIDNYDEIFRQEWLDHYYSRGT